MGSAALPTLPTLPTTTKPSPLPGASNLGSSAAAQPTVPGASTLPVSSPTTSTGQGTGVGTLTVPTTTISNGLNLTASQGQTNSNSLLGDFQATYGQGTGTALATTLSNLGTSTDAAVTATNQSILDAAGIQQANLEAGDAAAGLSKDSSSSALALGDFDSQVSQNIASTDANMELSEENTLISSLFQEGSAHGSDSSFMGSLSDFLQGGGLSTVGTAASALDAIPGTGGTALGSTLDILSGL